MISFLVGFRLLTKKDINAKKFAPGWENEDEDGYRRFEGLDKGHLSPIARVLLIVVSGIVCGSIAYAVTGLILVSLISSFTGLITPNIWYRWYKKNQESLIMQQMEQASETMASVIKSGGSMIAALEKAASESKEPLKKELIKASMELRLGVSTTEVFIHLAKRVALPEMLILSIGLELQQKGMPINTANMLLQIQKNIRQRQLLIQEIKTITTENKMAGWIVAAIPFLSIAMMRQFSPEFTDPLFKTVTGMSIFLTCTLIIIGGIYWVMKMTDMKEI